MPEQERGRCVWVTGDDGLTHLYAEDQNGEIVHAVNTGAHYGPWPLGPWTKDPPLEGSRCLT
jgi:hypothetical protein